MFIGQLLKILFFAFIIYMLFYLVRFLFRAGRMLHVELTSPAIVHWTSDRWDSVHDTPTIEAEHGLHVADLATESLEPGTRIQFTFFWTDAKRWEGEDFEILVECARQHAT